MSRDIGFLVDMLENARSAMSHAFGKSWEDFDSESLVQDAVIYRLGIVGEAAHLVSPEMKKIIAADPLRKIIAMRNLLFHDYHGVELSIVWEVLQVHAPALVEMIQAYLDDQGIRRE